MQSQYERSTTRLVLLAHPVHYFRGQQRHTLLNKSAARSLKSSHEVIILSLQASDTLQARRAMEHKKRLRMQEGGQNRAVGSRGNKTVKVGKSSENTASSARRATKCSYIGTTNVTTNWQLVFRCRKTHELTPARTHSLTRSHARMRYSSYEKLPEQNRPR